MELSVEFTLNPSQVVLGIKSDGPKYQCLGGRISVPLYQGLVISDTSF